MILFLCEISRKCVWMGSCGEVRIGSRLFIGENILAADTLTNLKLLLVGADPYADYADFLLRVVIM